MILLSIGDQVEHGTFELHSRFNRVVNFTKGQCLVSVVDEDIGPGPLNIVIRGLSPQERRVFSPWLRVGSNVVAFDNRRFGFSAGDRYHSGFRTRGWDRKRFGRNLAFFGQLLIETAPTRSLAFLLDQTRIGSFRPGFERGFVSRISQGVHHVFHNDLLCGIEILKGSGLGLTPSGDDFIAGLLIGVNLLQTFYHRDFRRIIDAVRKTAAGDNLFSNAFLTLAGRGWLFGRMKDLIEALTQEGENSIRASTGKLLAVGASSGADLGTGFFMTVRRGSGMMARWAEGLRRLSSLPNSVPTMADLAGPGLGPIGHQSPEMRKRVGLTGFCRETPVPVTTCGLEVRPAGRPCQTPEDLRITPQLRRKRSILN